MKQLFIAIRDALAKGESLVLCSIIASSGSTPRGKGAKLALFENGSTLGTVGGGAVEYESIRLAQKALEERAAFTHSFNLTKNQTADIGMICGGQVTVTFRFFSGGDPQALGLFEAACALIQQGRDAWLITEMAGGGAGRMGIYTREEGLMFTPGLEEAVILPLLKPRGVLLQGDPAYYVEPFSRTERVYVFGGGHVSQELVPLLAHVGFSVTVYEDRQAFASPALFPAADGVILGEFTELSAHITLGAEDYAVIMTRGHQADFEVLRQAMQTPAYYIGVIGSRQKIAATNARLIEAGIGGEALRRIHTPIGLSIRAETPAEIAVSIAAELILCRAEKV